MVFARQSVKGNSLLDGLLCPQAQSGVFGLPAHQPLAQVMTGFVDVAPVVEQTGRIGRARHVIKSVAKEVHVATLPQAHRQHLGDELFEALVLIGHRQVNTGQSPLLESNQKLPPRAGAFAVGQLHAQDPTAALPIPPPLWPPDGSRSDHSVLAHAFISCVEDEVGILLGERPVHHPLQLLVSCLVAADTVLALKLCPHSSSVTERTLRVEKPCTYISAIAKSGAFSLR